MTLPIPLTVRLATSDTDRHIEKELRSLSFRTVVPGGYASATFSLDRPLNIDPLEIAYYGKVYVYDRRDGTVVWEGRLEDPGRGVSGDGVVWDLAAVGPSAHAQDKVVPRVYVDGSLERWARGSLSDRGTTISRTDRSSDNETPAIQLTFQEGMSIDSTSNCDIVYRTLYDCGQELARIRTDYQNGVTNSTTFQNRLASRATPTGTGHIINDDDWTSGASSFNGARGSALNPITAGDTIANIRIMRYAGGATTASSVMWGEFWGISIRSLLKDINGSDITTANYYDNVYILAHEVITDLIGRGDLYAYDPASSTIDTTGTANIDQLAYPQGVTPAEILDALMDFEQAFYWAAWESQSNGKYRFEWKPWPTTIRYEADVIDGFDSPGSADGLFNEAIVSYLDWANRERTAVSTSTVADLTNAGLTRTLQIDLGDAENSLANAQRAGAQALLDHAAPPNQGTLTVARPIIDFTTGFVTQPWEILPGNLIRVRGVRANKDSLNTTVRDGVTVFKIAAVEYDTASATARLELDSYSRTVAAAIAALSRRPTVRRRRRR